MSGYTRTTRECPVGQLHPGLAQAIREYFQTHLLGDAETETRLCCETISERRDSGKLVSILEGEGDTTSHLAILMTSDWLIWALSGDRSGTVVSGAKLKVIRVKVLQAKQSKDMQLEVDGFVNNSKEYVRGALELGPEAAAQRFCEKVEKAVLKENPPAKRKSLRWFGG
jgi:hypothetical protein